MAAEHDGADRLSRSLDLLWGSKDKPSRGPKPALSLEKIVRAAIEIADAEGIDGLSMQQVAGRLGFTTMSLYRYVPGKDQLVDAMMDAASGPPPQLPAAEGWRNRIERWVQALWVRYQQHPWMLQVQASGPPLGPNQLAWLESSLSALDGTGLTAEEMLFVSLFLNGAATGLARHSTAAAQTAAHTGVPAERVGADYAQILERVLDTDRFPTLTRVVAAGAFRPGAGPGEGTTHDLEFGLQRLLDGIERYVEERTATCPLGASASATGPV
ncbi:TetR/AcrR family transcriptional regulator [Streptomyces ardesiacus]